MSHLTDFVFTAAAAVVVGGAATEGLELLCSSSRPKVDYNYVAVFQTTAPGINGEVLERLVDCGRIAASDTEAYKEALRNLAFPHQAIIDRSVCAAGTPPIYTASPHALSEQRYSTLTLSRPARALRRVIVTKKDW